MKKNIELALPMPLIVITAMNEDKPAWTLHILVLSVTAALW